MPIGNINPQQLAGIFGQGLPNSIPGIGGPGGTPFGGSQRPGQYGGAMTGQQDPGMSLPGGNQGQSPFGQGLPIGGYGAGLPSIGPLPGGGNSTISASPQGPASGYTGGTGSNPFSVNLGSKGSLPSFSLGSLVASPANPNPPGYTVPSTAQGLSNVGSLWGTGPMNLNSRR